MPLDQPLVSVLMTAYNRQAFIAEAIESVLSSTYTNFEFIIVDDCSSDHTLQISKSYIGKDSRIRVYQNEKNLGDYPNRNRAAWYAKGKYLKYVDSDDMIYPHALALFVAGMETFPDAAVGIMSQADQDNKTFPYQLSPAEAYRYHFYQRGLFDTGPSALIFKTESFNKMGGFSGKRFVGDTEINLKLAAQWPVVILAPSLIFWREHAGQEIVAGMNSTGYLEANLPLLTDELNKKGNPLSEAEKSDIIGYHRKMSAREIIKIALVKRKPRHAIRLYRKLSLQCKDLVQAILFKKKKY